MAGRSPQEEYIVKSHAKKKVVSEQPEPSSELQALYDEQYYATACGPIPYGRTEHWANFFALIADQIIRSLQPKRVLDAGCAMGLLVEALWDRGVEAYGIDISSYAISKVRPDMKSYCRVASLTAPIHERFDVVTCIEVLEHILLATPVARSRTSAHARMPSCSPPPQAIFPNRLMSTCSRPFTGSDCSPSWISGRTPGSKPASLPPCDAPAARAARG